jgi:hypothetical protein
MQAAFTKVRMELIANHLDESKYLANQEKVLNFASGFCQPDVGTTVLSKPAKKEKMLGQNHFTKPSVNQVFFLGVLLLIFIQNMLCNVPVKKKML